MHENSTKYILNCKTILEYYLLLFFISQIKSSIGSICIILHYSILYYIILYYIVLYYIITKEIPKQTCELLRAVCMMWVISIIWWTNVECNKSCSSSCRSAHTHRNRRAPLSPSRVNVCVLSTFTQSAVGSSVSCGNLCDDRRWL